MKERLKLRSVVLGALLTLVPFSSIATTLVGAVQDTDGVGIGGGKIDVLGFGVTSSNDQGRYEIEIGEQTHIRMSVRAADYYPMVYTLAIADWVQSGQLIVPPLSLVRRKQDRVMFAFAGDTMMGRRYHNPLLGEPLLINKRTLRQDTTALLKHIEPYFSAADIVGVNLETQIIDGPLPVSLPKSVTFYSPTALLDALKSSGVSYVALGNNHMYDYGKQGLVQTLQALQKSGLGSSGAGLNEQGARLPHRLKVGTNQYSLFSYVGWAGGFEPNQVASGNKGGAALGTLDILQADLAAAGSDAIVLQYHGGLEYASHPSMIEKTRLRGAVDAGADLVLAHHPHVLQGFELYQNKLIAYSMGNFLFDQYIYATQLSMVLYVWMDGDRFYRAEIVPVYLNGYVPTPATGMLRYDVLQRLVRLSNDEGLVFERTGPHASIRPGHDQQMPVRLMATKPEPNHPRSLYDLKPDPLRPIGSVSSALPRFRLGVDLIKRGGFEHWGEFGVSSRTWLMPKNVTVENYAGDATLVVQGPATTGLRTFERAFQRSNPATVSAHVKAQCSAKLAFQLQRRNLVQSRGEALDNGALTMLGAQRIDSGFDGQLSFDFDMPRIATKAVRLLVDIDQQPDCRMELDDLVLVEWTTAWLPTNVDLQAVRSAQATHLQFAR